jgi:hypothetical protein
MGTGATETRVQRSPTATIGVNYVFSIYAKASEYDQIELALVATPSVSARFSLTLGTVVSGTGATITDVGNGWYRCALPALAGATGALAVRWSAKSSTVLVGDGTSGIFAWGAQFEEVTYQTTPGTYNQTVASAYYGPRFDYNPATLAPRGLLIEEQRVNLALYSEQFDNAGWTKTRSSITANATTSPDGTANADRFVIDTTPATNHPVGQSTSVTSGTTYALTVFAKADQFSQINLRFSAQFPAGNAYYDLNSGTVSSSGTVVSASMTSFGNGWWRCVLVMTANATGASAPQIFLAQGNSITIATADGTSGLFIWGAQLEAGAFATSYIPTVASTVTRAADDASMTGTNFSSWYNASEGTVVANFGPFFRTTGNPGVVQIDDGAATNTIRTYAGSVVSPVFSVIVGGVSQAFLNAGTINTNANTSIAGAYALDNFAKSINGLAPETDASGTIPVVNRMLIGSGTAGVNFLNGYMRSITFYPQRLTNAQLQALTA